MSRRRCCCAGRDCEIYFDGYTSDNLATDYTIIDGEWSVDTSPGVAQLEEAGNNDALIQLDTRHPRPDETGEFRVTLTNVASGTDMLILVNYLDENNYLYGRIEYGGGGSVDLSVGKCTAGVETDLRGPVTINNAIIGQYIVCYGPKEDDDDDILLSLICDDDDAGTTHVAVYVRVAPHDGGYYVGLANRANVEINITEIYWYEFYMTNDTCLWCMCTCWEEDPTVDEILPPVLKATLASVSGCSNLDGQEFTLTFNPGNYANETYSWESTAWYCDDPTNEVMFQPQLICDGSSGGDAETAGAVILDHHARTPLDGLRCIPGCTEPCTCDPFSAVASSGTCRPLNLVFGPFTIPETGGADPQCNCCDTATSTFNIVVTEP